MSKIFVETDQAAICKGTSDPTRTTATVSRPLYSDTVSIEADDVLITLPVSAVRAAIDSAYDSDFLG